MQGAGQTAADAARRQSIDYRERGGPRDGCRDAAAGTMSTVRHVSFRGHSVFNNKPIEGFTVASRSAAQHIEARCFGTMRGKTAREGMKFNVIPLLSRNA